MELNGEQEKESHNYVNTPGRRQSKTLIRVLSTNVDQKSLETEFWIAICHLTGIKWQSKTLFLVIFNPCSSIVKSVLPPIWCGEGGIEKSVPQDHQLSSLSKP